MALNLDTVREAVAALYVGYFGRAAEPDGFDYWVQKIASGENTWEDAAKSFSVQPETTAQYAYLADPLNNNPDAFIDHVYLNLFNRFPDAEGRAFWNAELTSRQGDPQAIGQFILDIVSGANIASGDAATVQNKVAAGLYLTDALKAEGIGGTILINGVMTLDAGVIDITHEVLDGITADPETVQDAQQETDDFADRNGGGGNGGGGGNRPPIDEDVPTPSNPFIEGLFRGIEWMPGTPITITFSFVDDHSFNGYSWSPEEKAAVLSAMKAWEAVANIDFVEQDNGKLTFHLEGFSLDNAFGLYSPFEESITFYRDMFNNWEGNLNPGGRSYFTILHEIGHALGLKHPHSDQAGFSPFPGVTAGDARDFGTNSVNSALYTVMSYIRHTPPWLPVGEQNWGYPTTPMAFDIAAVQWLYGAAANDPTNNYRLQDDPLEGTYWQSIWDTHGTNAIEYAGDQNTVIHLRAAQLELQPPNNFFNVTGEGGFLSYVWGAGSGIISGGFTIAAGVAIRNASGGSGDDLIVGNALQNDLRGNGGIDEILGGGNEDTIHGGAQRDLIYGDFGFEAYEPLNTVIWAGDVFSFVSSTTYLNFKELVRGDGVFQPKDGQGVGAGDHLFGEGGNDLIFGGQGDDEIVGGVGEDTLLGGEGVDTILGGADNDQINGGDGVDILDGGDGGDTYLVLGEMDQITDSGSAEFEGGDILYFNTPVLDLTTAPITGIEYLSYIGTDPLTLTLYEHIDVVLGGAGSTVYVANAGDNDIWRGWQITASVGIDNIILTEATDEFTFFGGTADDSIDLTALGVDHIVYGWDGHYAPIWQQVEAGVRPEGTYAIFQISDASIEGHVEIFDLHQNQGNNAQFAKIHFYTSYGFSESDFLF